MSNQDATSTVEQQQFQRLEEIRAEVEKTALIGALEPIEGLTLYAENPGFLSQLPRLFSSYSHYRPVRGDGICFYRAALFQLGTALRSGGCAPLAAPPFPSPPSSKATRPCSSAWMVCVAP